MSAVPIVGVSGADGSGKSTFAVALAESVHRAGGIASVLHLYGCVACRRVRPQALPARLAGRREAAPLRAAHALVDAAEAWLRLSAARRHLARRARRSAVAGAVMLVTDRSPLMFSVASALRCPALGIPVIIPYCCCTEGSEAVGSVPPNSNLYRP